MSLIIAITQLNNNANAFDLNFSTNFPLELATSKTLALNIVSKDNISADIDSNIPAIRINKKILAIKGYSDENINNREGIQVLNLSQVEQISFGTSTESLSEEIIPIIVSMEDENTIPDIIELDQDGDITEYTVVSGDSVESIAKKFNISIDTVLWANDLNRKSTIKVGQKLVILPVSGVSYKIQKGDTVSGIALKFGITQKELAEFNNLDDNRLSMGETIIIPGGKVMTKNNSGNDIGNNAENNSKNASKNASKKVEIKNNKNNSTKLVKPINGVKTQGIHGFNAVDFGAPIGTDVVAALSGKVSLLRGGNGWNGGYGNYIVITHTNGVQTLYAHLDEIKVSSGQIINAGELIGYSGNTGRSTGPHLHFEVRGSKNPF